MQSPDGGGNRTGPEGGPSGGGSERTQCLTTGGAVSCPGCEGVGGQGHSGVTQPPRLGVALTMV